MQSQDVPQKAGSAHTQQRGEVLTEDMGHAELIVAMRFLKKLEISFEAVLSFPLLNFSLHERNV